MHNRPKGLFPDAPPAGELLGDAHHVAVELGRQEVPQAHPNAHVKNPILKVCYYPGGRFHAERGIRRKGKGQGGGYIHVRLSIHSIIFSFNIYRIRK